MKPLSLLLALLLPLFAAATPADDLRGVVSLDSGRISGDSIAGEPAVRVYRGIPYAAPPVGPLRWRPPAPVAKWDGVRPCTEFGPACPQPGNPLGRTGPAKTSEDCLTLNVWTAAAGADAALPVMVWIHGGGHVIGAGSLPVYDGTALARSGVVLVTMNYRLGPFGYLAHPLFAKESKDGTSGNYGMMDQIAALRWVRRNIAAFGGDPARVTIFGESAGAVSVSCLLACPAAKGLFERAIAESGGPTGVAGKMPFEQGLAVEKALDLGEVEDRLAALRAVPAEALLAAASPEAATLDRGRKYGPCVDGVLLPEAPKKAWREGKVLDVPFLAGTNADDGGVFSQNLPVRSAFVYRIMVRARYHEHAAEVLALFPPDDDARLALRRLLTVGAFALPARLMVRGAFGGRAPAYLYQFTRVCAGAKLTGVGAAHGLEIPYVFGTAGRGLGFTEVDEKLADAMRRYWTAFAATGDPNAKGLPEWPAYDPDRERYLELGDRIRAGEKLFAKECDLIERIGFDE